VTLASTASLSKRDEKAWLRDRLRRLRAEQGFPVGSAESMAAAAQVASAVLSLPSVARAQSVAVYEARGRELDPSLLVSMLGADTIVCYPRVASMNPPTLTFHVTSRSALRPSGFDLLEPGSTEPLAPSIDVFVVPGLGFDRSGRRIGQGKGFYDATLRMSPSAVRVGIGYDFQLISEIPVESCDEPVDFVITPTQKLATGARASVLRFAEEDVS
jgi:5-formyltetrahydrofolate cyclo-ligase